MPKWDTTYLDAMAAQGSGLLGRTPEFKMMQSQMEVTTTMHGGFRDDVKWVQPEAMQQVHDYLLDALCAPPDAAPKSSWACFEPAPAANSAPRLHAGRCFCVGGTAGLTP